MPWTNQGGGGPWGSGGKGPWGSGPQSSGPTPPDLEEILRRGQDKLRRVLPGGNLGGRGFALIVLGVLALWGFSGFFRVEPDELGVVLRFGKEVREVQPGLNYHLPYPIETVLTPKALRVNKIDIGMRVVDDIRRGGTTVRDVPEESLMLTGDENIVDVDFLGAVESEADRRRRIPVQHPESGRHGEGGGGKRHARGDRPLRDPADSHRRAADHRDGRAGPDAEDARSLRRRHHRAAGAAAEGRSADAGDRRFPRRAGRARRSRARGQRSRRPTPTGCVPEARGRVAQITQAAEAYKSQTVAEATGQTSRFLKIYEQYKKAPDVTRERMYLETMERVLGGTDKIILDSGRGRQRRSALSAAQ